MKKYRHRLEVGTNPQESLTQGDEHRNVLDSVGIKVLALYLVVVQQSPKKLMGGVANPRSWK